MTHIEKVIQKQLQMGNDSMFIDNHKLETPDGEYLRKHFEVAEVSNEGVKFLITVPRKRKAKKEIREPFRREVHMDRTGSVHIPEGMTGATLKGKVKRVKILSDRARNAVVKAVDSRSGGCTINPKGQEVKRKDGYMVSLYGSEERVRLGELNSIGEAIFFITRKLQENMADHHVGVWISNGYAVIDYSMLIMSKDVALNVGKAQQQEAIYGWAEDACFDC